MPRDPRLYLWDIEQAIADAIVWQTAKGSLPLLKAQVIALREALGAP